MNIRLSLSGKVVTMTIKAAPSGQVMCYVIAYDIPEDGRRTKVHKLFPVLARGHNIRYLSASYLKKS